MHSLVGSEMCIRDRILSEKKLMQLEKYTTKKKKEKLYNFLNYRGWEIDLINEQIKKIY